MNATSLVRAVANMTAISVSTDAGTFHARFDDLSKRIKVETELFGTQAKEEFALSAAGGFAITSTAAILSRASKLLGASSDPSGARVRVHVRTDDERDSNFEFRLPLRTSTLSQLKTFFQAVQAHARARKGKE